MDFVPVFVPSLNVASAVYADPSTSYHVLYQCIGSKLSQIRSPSSDKNPNSPTRKSFYPDLDITATKSYNILLFFILFVKEFLCVFNFLF